MACSCEKQCIFKGLYQDMGASFPVCTRFAPDLLASVSAYGVEKCPYYISFDMVKTLQEQGIIKTIF